MYKLQLKVNYYFNLTFGNLFKAYKNIICQRFEDEKNMLEVKIVQFLDSSDWRLFQKAFGHFIVFVPQNKPNT